MERLPEPDRSFAYRRGPRLAHSNGSKQLFRSRSADGCERIAPITKFIRHNRTFCAFGLGALGSANTLPRQKGLKQTPSPQTNSHIPKRPRPVVGHLHARGTAHAN
jgi:hypothetical protein